jgi:hypothetical protein
MAGVYKTNPYRPFTGYIPYEQTVSNRPEIRNLDGTFDPLNADLDLYWAGASKTDPRFSNYYDYFFSGEDVKVYIDGLFDEKDELDIQGFGFMIKQEKQAVYGFWSYNFDAIMNGTRIITGQFSVYSRYPRRMTEMLERAAEARVQTMTGKKDSSGVVSVMRSQNESLKDEENIQKYWANSQLDRVTTDPAITTGSSNNGHNIFSAHPPFNFIIMYGVDDSSLSPIAGSSNKSTASMEQRDNLDRLISTDINERKIKLFGAQNAMKIVLQNVHLMQMATEYQGGGVPIVETYAFVARDFYFTEAGTNLNPYTGKKTSVTQQSKYYDTNIKIQPARNSNTAIKT